MNGVSEKVLEYAEALPEGGVVAAKALLHVGSRAAVDQALSRLAREGRLMRAGRGLYVSPVRSRFGVRAPRPEKVAEGIARVTGEAVTPSGAAAANALGLTTQVPVRVVYYTSGRSRRIPLGRQVLELQHTPTWLLYGPGRPAGQALRALAWLGPAGASAASETLQNRLPHHELEALLSARTQMPSWLAETVSRKFHPAASATLAAG